MLGPSWKNHFTLEQFYPVHDRPVTFIVSQWQHDKTTPNFKYSLYRISIFIIFFVSWIFTIVKDNTFDGSSKWPIYLTNWGFTLCTVQALLACIMLITSLLATRFSGSVWKENILRMYPVYWVVNTIATPVAFTITVIYWSIIYSSENNKLTAMNFLVHGSNSILMFFDLWVVSHPVRILHFFYPLVLALTYTIFTVIYYFAGGVAKGGSRYIYPILKWDQPASTTLICLGVMTFMIFLHLLVYFAFKLRIKLYEVLFLPRMKPTKFSVKHAPKSYVNHAMASETV